MSHVFDCQTCGACCTNPLENRNENYIWYLEIKETPLLDRPRELKRWVMYDDDGVPHLRLLADGRCIVLRGKIGHRVHCMIYSQRPKGCRLLQPGDPRCVIARREQNIV